jgi:hypothetical protein
MIKEQVGRIMDKRVSMTNAANMFKNLTAERLWIPMFADWFTNI